MTTNRRARKGYTFEPCPGCGSVDEIYPRPKTGVCEKCRLILDAHARQVSDLAKKSDVMSMYAIPEYPHWLPYIPSYSDKQKNVIREGFWKLGMAVSDVNIKDLPENKERLFKPNITDTQPWVAYHPKDYRLMYSHVAENLRALFDDVRAELHAAYSQGKTDGTNLLAMLNNGELTTSDFEKRAGIIRT